MQDGKGGVQRGTCQAEKLTLVRHEVTESDAALGRFARIGFDTDSLEHVRLRDGRLPDCLAGAGGSSNGRKTKSTMAEPQALRVRQWRLGHLRSISRPRHRSRR